MIIYPAIDLKDGKCVRLHKGDMDSQTIYNDDPAAQARSFATDGFSWIHIVDLNGAIKGRPINEEAVKSIIDSVDLPVQLGGGIRSLQQIETWLEAGINRVILGTIAIKNPELVKQACHLFPGQIVLGFDAYDQNIAVEGWVEKSGHNLLDHVKSFEDSGASAIIYTDINRDGTGQGLNMPNTIALAQHVSIPVIASGGVGSIQDLEAVRSAKHYGVEGVIIGKALYDGRIQSQDALKIAA